MKSFYRYLTSLFIMACPVIAQDSVDVVLAKPDALVDLRTKDGVSLVSGAWRYTNAELKEIKFNAPGPSEDGKDSLKLYPTGKPTSSHDVIPMAGVRDFDDSKWEAVDPNSMEQRRGTGRFCAGWYRINVKVPNKLGDFDPTGSTVVFEVVVDDYAEVWVDGKLPKRLGKSGGSVVSGFNARNRVVLTSDAKPGESFQIAVFALNGPVSTNPGNYLWLRSCSLKFNKTHPRRSGWEESGIVKRESPALDSIIAPGTKIEKVATGFQFTEGPVWHPDGYFLFSGPNVNVIYAWDPITWNVSVHTVDSGYTGVDIGRYSQPGSNGLTIDAQGRLVVCQHGNRRVIRHEIKGPITVLADSYDGKRLNSPNDLVFHSSGALYFTDPPYGLPEAYNDPAKEQKEEGIYRVQNGKVTREATDLGGPNGIAFSPDEKFLYVSNWDIRDIHNTKVIHRYPVAADGSLGKGALFFDMNKTEGDEALDGLKIDKAGNIYASGPGGVWIISSKGEYLGLIAPPERPHNMAWGDDGSTLYMAAPSSIYRIHTKTGGKLPGPINK